MIRFGIGIAVTLCGTLVFGVCYGIGVHYMSEGPARLLAIIITCLIVGHIVTTGR